MIRRPLTSSLLVCDQCIKLSDEEARGWRALHGCEDDETEVVVVLCPDCAAAFEADSGEAPKS